MPGVTGLRAELEPYADRIAIGGTGVAYTGVVGHAVGLPARACGDFDAAAAHLRSARQRALDAGLTPAVDASDVVLAQLRRGARLIATPAGAPTGRWPARPAT